jgi:integrase
MREEQQALLAAPMRRRKALAIRYLLAAAVRSAELCQAKWADVDLDGAQWHIRKSKTGAAMDIPLAPAVVDWFRELRTRAGSSAYVLPARSRSRAAASANHVSRL